MAPYVELEPAEASFSDRTKKWNYFRESERNREMIQRYN